ncbi:RDD family protein [Castellaniella sp.]|uniref:RDD family protein n=1 Tax=Castellaniella sp. TaxID=1955812 RepID=UPI003569B73A
MNQATRPPPASRRRRFACMIYEGILLFGVVFLAGYLLDTLTQSRHGLMWRPERQIFLFVAIGLYFLVSWRRNGQTLPMKTWGIRLADPNGQTPGFTRLLLRYLLLWPLPLLSAWLVARLSAALQSSAIDMLIVLAPFSLFIWTWFDPRGQFLHDRILGTELLAQPRPGPQMPHGQPKVPPTS